MQLGISQVIRVVSRSTSLPGKETSLQIEISLTSGEFRLCIKTEEGERVFPTTVLNCIGLKIIHMSKRHILG